ncbi:MAG: glycosyl hydrolase, family 88, partial [Phycisphaerales bacterium]|nr:glycosyl hydrolase, family 88 [Phycisphaerales bacterium]
TWTRGLAWILCGYPEQLEFLATRPESEPAFARHGGKAAVLQRFLATAEAVADFYLEHTPTDGVPYWDTGAPGLARMGDYLSRPADPYNDHEPVDSSAAVIAAQGLLRLGRYLKRAASGGDAAAAAKMAEKAARYWQAGLTVARTALAEPYLSADPAHEGLVLHSVYHRPNGWDHVPPGRRVPCGESSMWGDYHARELALLLKREAEGKGWLAFFEGEPKN